MCLIPPEETLIPSSGSLIILGDLSLSCEVTCGLVDEVVSPLDEALDLSGRASIMPSNKTCDYIS